MEKLIIPAIILVCYLFCEFMKIILKKNTKTYKLIPILSGVLGGILGIIIYYVDPKYLMDIKSPLSAITIGIASGLVSSGTTAILKTITTKSN